MGHKETLAKLYNDINGTNLNDDKAWDLVIRRLQGLLNDKQKKEIESIEFEPPQYSLSPEEDYDETLRSYRRKIRDQLLNQMRVFIEHEQLVDNQETTEERKDSEDINMINKNIFIVHGQDEQTRDAVKLFLTELELNPKVLFLQANVSRVLIEKLEQECADCCFAIILLTPDDVFRKWWNKIYRARQNVVFEYGYFMGKFDRKNLAVIFKDRKGFEHFSDTHGMGYISWHDPRGWKNLLAQELDAAGIQFDPNKVIGLRGKK